MPFWCGNFTLHENDKDYQHTARCCTTHIIGLPRHPATNEEMPLTPYQIDFASHVINGRKNFGNTIQEQARKPLLIHLNKGRQMGFTEIALRIILHLSFSRYAGSNIGIIAATNGNLAKKDLRRLATLYKAIPGAVQQWVKSNTMQLSNGTVIEAFPASEEAMTGDTKYKCIFMDESGKWKLVDDTPVFNSILPIVRSNGADLLLVSTPKGPVKMFYHIHEEPGDFTCYKYDIHKAEGNLYTKEQIQNMLDAKDIDTEQEYLCKFTTAQGSIFGPVSNDERHGLSDLLLDDQSDLLLDESEEDDSYEFTLEDTKDDRIFENQDSYR